MKNYILFLNGKYNTKDINFYKHLCDQKITVAVDGGFSFFKKARMIPDILIGDMDSVKGKPYITNPEIKLILFPPKKNETDSQLAVEYCIKNNAQSIDIIMPSVGEWDHCLGNLMLLTNEKILKATQQSKKIKIINKNLELFYLKDNQLIFSNYKNNIISVIPFSKSIILNSYGMEYHAENLKIKRGHSHSLRNRIKTKRAKIIVQGEAFVIHEFSEEKFS